MSSIDDRLQRVRAFLHFQSLNPDKCHVSPEAEDAIAFAAEIERLRGLLLRVNQADRHFANGAYWVQLYHDDFEAFDAALARSEP